MQAGPKLIALMLKLLDCGQHNYHQYAMSVGHHALHSIGSFPAFNNSRAQTLPSPSKRLSLHVLVSK